MINLKTDTTLAEDRKNQLAHYRWQADTCYSEMLVVKPGTYRYLCLLARYQQSVLNYCKMLSDV